MALSREQILLKNIIPSHFWGDGSQFKQELATTFIALMKVPDSELEVGLATLNSSSLDKNTKKGIWIALTSSHPHLTNEQLRKIGRQLELVDEDLFQSALLLRNVARFENLLAYFESEGLLTSLIKAKQYFIFRWAAEHGEMGVLGYLAEKKPTAIPAMITTLNFDAFKKAVTKRKVDVVKFICERAGAYLEDMLASDNYDAFLTAMETNNQLVVNYLLNYSSLFAHAEEHEATFSAHVLPFTDNKLQTLRAAKNQYEIASPRGVFDVSPTEAKLLFYVLRSLIRRNEPGLSDQMLFLLEIPAVKNLVHREVTAGKSNELIRLALANNNRSAIDILIAIPAVHDLAEENNYYHDELRGAIDLRALADDRESSMTALSQGEQDRLKQVSERYDTQLKHLSVPGVMVELRAQLKTRYDANPAFIMTLDSNTGQLSKTVLPMDWKDFKELNLSLDDQEKALKAYYQHTDHSAWRYLLKPNPWMHEHAHYVYTNPDNEHERWAAFEEYQSLISLLYLAAKDTETPATDGYTIATRVEQFIKELALIARAHNWDKQRIKILDGVPLLDDDDQPIMEEYDDLEADCPSCYSGIKRRLFQAVQGHPLLVFLTADKINAELYEFARKYFSAVINDSNRGDFKSAWNKVISGEELKAKDWSVLKSADFSPLKQTEFIQVLTDKYGKQFADDPYLPKKVTQAFLLNSPSDAHLLKFGYTHPEQFFDEPKVKAKGPGFFESSSKVAGESETSDAIIKPRQS